MAILRSFQLNFMVLEDLVDQLPGYPVPFRALIEALRPAIEHCWQCEQQCTAQRLGLSQPDVRWLLDQLEEHEKDGGPR